MGDNHKSRGASDVMCMCGHDRVWHVGPTGEGLGSGPACHCGCDGYVARTNEVKGAFAECLVCGEPSTSLEARCKRHDCTSQPIEAPRPQEAPTPDVCTSCGVPDEGDEHGAYCPEPRHLFREVMAELIKAGFPSPQNNADFAIPKAMAALVRKHANRSDNPTLTFDDAYPTRASMPSGPLDAIQILTRDRDQWKQRAAQAELQVKVAVRSEEEWENLVERCTKFLKRLGYDTDDGEPLELAQFVIKEHHHE